MNDKQIPMYASDLINKLDVQYPHKCLKPGEDKDEAIFYAGKRMLIDDLLSLITEEENRNVL